MDLTFSKEDLDFQKEVQIFLKTKYPIEIKEKQEKIFKEHFKKHSFPFKESYVRRSKWNEKILFCLNFSSSK